MTSSSYRLDKAELRNGDVRYVIVDEDDNLHVSSRWLAALVDVERSPNTVKAYGGRLASFLSWISQTTDWRRVTIADLSMWRRVLSAPNESGRTRRPETVTQWLIPLRGFYEWAHLTGHVGTDIATRMTEMKYFPAGTAGGGEHGKYRSVFVEQLRPVASSTPPTHKWIDDPKARDSLLALDLRPRDRFLIDLLYFTGVRVGEALSLFIEDLHFGGGSEELGCEFTDPHFHVGARDDDLENAARAKSGARVLYVGDRVTDAFVEYVKNREQILGQSDRSEYLFVNLYGTSIGHAMSYSGVRKLIRRCSRRIVYPFNGPHVLRHTLATRLLRGLECEKVSLDVVQAILGHVSIDSTRIYTHDLEKAKREALVQLSPRTVALGGAS